jgi:hypothetical protein
MKNGQEQFDVATLQHIRNKLDYIYSISKEYNNDNPLLMETIASLTKVANMLAKNKLEDLNGDDKTSSPQGFIVKNLGNAYLSMKDYEKQKDTDFPVWKL